MSATQTIELMGGPWDGATLSLPAEMDEGYVVWMLAPVSEGLCYAYRCLYENGREFWQFTGEYQSERQSGVRA